MEEKTRGPVLAPGKISHDYFCRLLENAVFNE